MFRILSPICLSAICLIQPLVAAVTITGQPASKVIIKQGDTEILTVTASDDQPIKYQWYRDQTALDGAESASLKISLPGEYYCRINGIQSKKSTVVKHLAPSAALAGWVLFTDSAYSSNSIFTYKSDGIKQTLQIPENYWYNESLTFSSPTVYKDPDGDVFSAKYRKIDAFTAVITSSAVDGNGRFVLKFTDYDPITFTLHGTFVYSATYQGNSFLPDGGGTPAYEVSKTTGSGIFSLKLR